MTRKLGRWDGAHEKLRVQEHLGFPVLCLDVKGPSRTKMDESKSLQNEDKFEQLRRLDFVHVS